mgnify:CR=1 FL=1
MKRWKVYLCAAVFLLLTAVKMIAPAAAADARKVLLPAINADDDYKSVFAEIRSVFAPAPVQTQDEQLRQYLPAVNMSVWSTPAPEPTPTPTPEPTPEPTPTPTPEPTQSPQLQAALAAREAFLNEQAVYSGYAVPTNVSYAVSELPFAHTSPVAGYTSSGFGYRLHPLENKVKFHYGTDFAANSGTAVCAFADGTVLAAGQDDGYGNYVKIRHADGYTTLYGHCSKLLVRAGETVTAGQEITLVCATGGRIDHMLANLSLLEEAREMGGRLTILDSCNRIVLHEGGREKFIMPSAYRYFSIVPLDAVLTGVTIENAKYPLENGRVTRAGMVSISNEAAPGSSFAVTIEKGAALIIFAHDSARRP